MEPLQFSWLPALAAWQQLVLGHLPGSLRPCPPCLQHDAQRPLAQQQHQQAGSITVKKHVLIFCSRLRSAPATTSRDPAPQSADSTIPHRLGCPARNSIWGVCFWGKAIGHPLNFLEAMSVLSVKFPTLFPYTVFNRDQRLTEYRQVILWPLIGQNSLTQP